MYRLRLDDDYWYVAWRPAKDSNVALSYGEYWTYAEARDALIDACVAISHGSLTAAQTAITERKEQPDYDPATNDDMSWSQRDRIAKIKASVRANRRN